MADFFKSAAQAGMEVRRRGQLPPDDDRDPWLTELGKVASEGMQIVQPVVPRRGISAPPQDDLQTRLDALEAKWREEDGLVAQESQPTQPQSEGTFLGDVGRSVVRGGIALGGGAYELGNLATQGGLDTVTKKAFGTSGTEAISGARESLNKQDSPELQAQRAELEKADGFWNSMGTVLSNPRLLGSMAVEMVPQMATVIGAAKTVATRTLASQIAQGATKEVAEKAAQRAATMTVMGVNPALEAGMAASDVRSSIMQMSEADLQTSPQYQALLAQGVNPEDARGRLANDAANFAAVVAAPISLASNTLTAGFEARLATGQVGKQFGLKRLGKEVGEGVIKEPIQESIEEGGSQFGQNVGMQQAVRPDQDLLAGVPQAAGAGAALGVVAGAGFGAANARFGLTKDPNAQGSTTPPAGTSGGTTAPADPANRPVNLELTENQFNASLQSPRIVPFMTALWANSDELTQTRIQELARRNNLMVDFAVEANNPEVMERGADLIRQSGDQFVSSFVNTMNRELAKQDVTPLPPKTPEKTPAQLQQEFDENQGFDVADNAIASAEALGIQPRTKAEAPATNVPGPNVLLRGYQRRAENLRSQPLAARRAAATSSITEMVGRGFSADQAQEIFGPLMQETPDATPDIQGSAADVSPVPAADVLPETVPSAAAPVVEAKAEPAETPADKETVTYQEAPKEEGVLYTPEVVVENKDYVASGTGSEQIIDLKQPHTSGEFTINGMRVTRDGTFFNGNTPKSKSVRLSVDDNYLELQSAGGGFARMSRTELQQEQLFRRVVGDAAVDAFLESSPQETQKRFSAVLLNKDYLPVFDRLSKLFDDKYSARTEEAPAQETETKAEPAPAPAIAATPQPVDRQLKDGSQVTVETEPAPKAFSNLVRSEFGQPIALVAKDESGQEVGRLTYMEGGGPIGIFVEEKDRRRGVGTALYNELEARGGKIPDEDSGVAISDEARAVRASRAEAPAPKSGTTVPKKVTPKAEDIEIPNRPGTPGVEQDSPIGRARNPNIETGTFRTESEPAPDVVEQDRMRKEAKQRRAERMKQRPAELKKPRRKPRPGRQLEVGSEGVDRKVLASYISRANQIMTNLVSKSAVRQRIAELDAALERLSKNKTFGRSDVEYIFGQFAQAGALSREESDDLSNQERNREMATSLRNRINDLQSKDLQNRAEAIKLNIQAVEEALADLRAEMEEDGIPQNIIDNILLEKENGVAAIISGREDSETDLIDAIREQLVEAGIPQEQIDSLISQAQQPTEDLDSELEVNEELFGDAAQAAAQVVDAIGNEADTPRALAILKAEANAANVGNLDIYNEMRLRGMEVSPEMISFASRPGIRFTLDFWMKKNEGRNPYTVRDEWFGSIAQTLRDLDGRKADQDEILNALSPEESKLFKDWRQQRADLRTRLAERVKSDGINEYPFDTIDNAFPHVLFNKFPLSSMFDVTKIPDADRPALLALAGGDADALPSLWYSDVNAVLSARPDLEGQVQDTLSEDEYAQYQEWRNRQTRIELARAKSIAQSPAFSQLFQLQSLLDPEVYENFRAQISVAQQNQLPAILQSAYELAEQQRLAQERDVDQATEAVMDAVYAQDETHLSAVEADAVPDTDGALNESNEQMTDEGAEPDAILDQFRDIRFKRGRYSGVTAAAEIFAHLNKITSGWNRAPQFQVLNSINQLPEDLREQALAKLGTQSAKGMIGPDGQVYIFSDFIENLADAEFVFFHEIYGHFGLRAFLGNKLDAFLQNQYKINQRVRAAADALIAEAKETGRGMSVLEATEEAIADLAVSNQEPGLFVQILQALRKFFRSIGMDSVAKWLDERSHKDLAFVLSTVRKSVREGIISPMDGAPEDIRFVANQNPVEIFVTRNGKTNVYGMYNALTSNWTVFYNPNGLEANNYGIQTFDSYADALAYARQYGKVVSAKDHPKRQTMGPGDFNRVSIKPPSDVTGWKKYARLANMTMVKKLLPILEVVEQIKAQGGETNLWQAITLYRGRIKPYFDQFRREFLRPIAAALDTITKNGDSYTFDGVEYTGQDLVDLYLLAKHAKERNETIENIRPDKKDGSGLKDIEATKILKDLEQTKSIAELKQISALMQRLSKMKVNYMLGTSLINEAQAKALKNYQFYVNLSGNRTDSDESVNKAILGGRSINLRGNDVKRALGRESLPVDILENTMNNYLGVILRGQKNIVALSVYDMVVKNPDPSFAIVNPFAFIKKLNVDKLIADKNILRAIGEQPTYESGLEYLRELAAEVDLDPSSASEVAGKIYRRLEEAYQQGKLSGNQFAAYTQKIENASIRTTTTKAGDKTQILLSPEGYVTDVLDVDKMNQENVFVAKVAGKPVAIEFMEGVDDRAAGKVGTFASALHGINNDSSGPVAEAFGWVNRLIGQLITSKNLAWVPVNWMRDIGTAYFNAAADPRVGKELAKKMFQRAPQSYAVAFKNLIADEYTNETGPVYAMLKKLGSKPVDADTEAMWKEFVSSGAQVFFMDRKDMNEQIKEMQRELNPRGGLLGTWDAYGRFADFIGIPAEASARFAAYRTLREAGWTKEDAAVYAKEITVNFEQTGSWRAMRNFFMFANPAIQGNVRMFRDSVTKTKDGIYVPNAKFMKIVGLLAGFGFIMGFVARAFGDNGDDEINDLDKIPRYKRATSVVVVPGMPMGSPIPMPYGWNVFYALGNFTADSLFGKTPASTSAGRVVASAIDAFWPLGQSESGTVLGTALKVFTPTPFSPAVDIALNESKFGGPIAKGDNPFVKSEEANAYMNFNSASPISVFMARGLNELFGGNQYRSGGIGRNALDKPIIPLDINPAYIDYLFASYLPGPFTDVGRLANLSINKAMGKDIKNPPVPLIDRFGSRISEGWDAGAFRTASTFLETKVAEAKAAPTAQRDAILKEYPNLGQARDALKTIDQQIRNMRTHLRGIEANPNIPSREKVEARNKIQALEKEYYKRGVGMAIKAGFEPQLLSAD